MRASRFRGRSAQNDEIPIAVKLAKMDDGDEYNRQGNLHTQYTHEGCDEP